MSDFIRRMSACSLGLLLATTIGNALIQTLDQFENKNGWTRIKADGVHLNLFVEPGISGKAIRLDYDFAERAAYKPSNLSMT